MLQTALEVARREKPELEAHQVRAEVKRLAARYRDLVGTSTEPARRADAFRRLLFESEHYEAVADLESPETLYIDAVLKRRKGYCLSLSVIALAVAEEVGAPLFGVAAPNHFFVRYDDGSFRRNLELTRKGTEVTDAEFKKRFGRFLADGALYLRNLKLKEVRAFLIHNRGYVALSRKRFKQARADFEEAIRLVPELNEAHRNLGVLLGERKQWEAAQSSFTRALALYPGDADALINLAICRHTLGDLDAAVQDLEMALVLDPERERTHRLLREWQEERQSGHTHHAAKEAMPKPPADLKAGLRGRYYAGAAFDRMVVERIDATIDFDWKNRSPARGVPADGFSIRWDGYLKAPRTGTYTFFLVANDGSRLKIGDDLVLKNWRDMGYKNWYGSKDVKLAAGWHKIRIEHYDARGGARIILRIGLEGRKDPLPLNKHLFHRAN
jgi:regulator of sirC expression with transglutaminase-like and TPR domain